MTTISPLPLDTDHAAALVWFADLLSATRTFLAGDQPNEDAAAFAELVIDSNWATIQSGEQVGHYLRRFYPGVAEAAALADAWQSGGRWWQHVHADWMAEHPREALGEKMIELSWLVLRTRWSADTEYACWQVAVLGQPPAVYQGQLAKANGQWLNGAPDAPESRALVAEVRRLHELAGGWWWCPDPYADGPVFLTTAQWEQVYARELHNPDRGCDVVSIRADGTRKVYRGREGIGQWLDENPDIADAMGGGRKPRS